MFQQKFLKVADVNIFSLTKLRKSLYELYIFALEIESDIPILEILDINGDL